MPPCFQSSSKKTLFALDSYRSLSATPGVNRANDTMLKIQNVFWIQNWFYFELELPVNEKGGEEDIVRCGKAEYSSCMNG